MLLCDRVAAWRGGADWDTTLIRTAIDLDETLTRRVRNCPTRYVLAPDVSDNVIAAAIEQPKHLRLGLAQLRLPHELFWLEWLEQRAADGPLLRAGLLVESDETGRRGVLSSVWMDEDAGPFRAPARFHFDFDRILSARTERHVHSPDEQRDEDYNALFDHAVFAVDENWLEQVKSRAANAPQRCVSSLFAVNARDFPLLCSFLLLLAEPRALCRRRSELGKLNRVRSRRGKAALLDHVELHMHLDRRDGRDRAVGGARDLPRRHWVRGHFVTRDDKVFWRRHHLRGDATRGVIAHRTVHLAR